MKHLQYSILFLIFSLLSCNTNDNAKKLNKFLNENFKLQLNNNENYIFFIPNSQCKNCINFGLINDSKLSDNVYIISGFPKSKFEKVHNYFYDENNEMFNLEFINYSNTLIKYENNKIVSVKNNIDILKELEWISK